MLNPEHLRRKHNEKSELPSTPDVRTRLESGDIWEDAKKLERFGFPAAKYLKTNGELDKQLYVNEFLNLKKDTKGAYTLNEINIPERLVEATLNQELVALHMADFGLGHRREAATYELLCMALGIDVKMVDWVKVEKGESITLAKHLMIAFYERYQQVSHTEGYKNGSAHKEVKFSKSKAHPLVNLLLDTWKKIDYEGYHQLTLGNPNWNTEKVDKWMERIKKLAGKKIQHELYNSKFTRHLIFWPKVSILGFTEPTLMVTTDSVVDPRTWKSQYPTLVEFPLTKEQFISVLGKNIADQILCFNGFPTPLGGLTRQKYLANRRSQEINNPDGLPHTLVLTASGVATAQKKLFEQTLIDLAPHVASGKLHIIIQAGYGDLGDQVYTSINDLSKTLEDSYPGFLDNLIIHYSTAQGAVDFGEVLSSGEAPMTFLVKGGEWTRMLTQLGIPQIVPVAIGDQENWNIITDALQDACIAILPTAYEQVNKFIDTFPRFPEELKRSAHLATNRHRYKNLEEALEMTELAISEKRTVVETNRRAMVEVMEWLMNQPINPK